MEPAILYLEGVSGIVTRYGVCSQLEICALYWHHCNMFSSRFKSSLLPSDAVVSALFSSAWSALSPLIGRNRQKEEGTNRTMRRFVDWKWISLCKWGMSDAEFGPTLLLSVPEKGMAYPEVRDHVQSNRPIQYGSRVTAHAVKLKSSCCINTNLLPSNGNVFTEPFPRNGRCLQSHRLATGLFATIL
jgi:hypothetical protein